MIESKETGNITKPTIFGEWVTQKTKDEEKYQDAIKVFFPEGIIYKKEILLREDVTDSDTIIGSAISYESPKIVTFESTDSSQLTDTLTFYDSEDGEIFHVEFDLNDADGSGFSSIVTQTSIVDNVEILEWKQYRSFKMKVNFQSDITGTVDHIKFEDIQGFNWKLITSKETEDGNFLLSIPVMDCSDYVSFLWHLVNYGQILKYKIFNCDILIKNQYEKIKSLERLSMVNSLINQKTFKDFMESVEVGDIFIFSQADKKHCIIVTNPKNFEYAENSGFVQNNLGVYYNGKINPYPFELRFNELAKNSEVYKVSLYK